MEPVVLVSLVVGVLAGVVLVLWRRVVALEALVDRANKAAARRGKMIDKLDDGMAELLEWREQVQVAQANRNGRGVP